MGMEIERKFLVIGTDWQSYPPQLYRQGYLNRDKERTVRVRIAGDIGFLTIKGLTRGASRPEFEYTIPIADAEQMIQLCEPPLIEKNRRVVPFAGMDWEVDEFLGENQGLVVAEIELESVNQVFERPPWIGDEVTTDDKYFNSNLAQHPYRSW